MYGFSFNTSQVVAALRQFESLVEYIHVSDQYCGPKQQE